MKKISSQTNKTDNNEFYVELFKLFLSKLPKYFILPNSIIPYHACRLILCNYRYTVEQVEHIVSKWKELGLIIPVKFRGFRINQKFLKGDHNE